MATWKLSTEIESNFDGGVMRAKWLIGGVRIVKTKAMRNSLPFLYRYLTAEETTLCFIESENQLYKLINNPTTNTTTDADWELVNLGGTSTLTPIGTWDVNNLAPALTDASAAGLNGNFYFITGAPTPDTITIPGLFGGQPVTVLDGNLVVSVGSQWIIVSNGSSWDSIDKPQSIIDYVNGIVIHHTHSVSDIVDMGDYLDVNGYLKRSDTADHTVPFDDVPNSAIIEMEFLKQWYYNKQEIEDLISDLEDGGITTFTGLLDTPNSYVGEGLKFPRVNVAENALEFVGLNGLFWNLSGTSTLSANAVINLDGKNIDFVSGVDGVLAMTPTTLTSYKKHSFTSTSTTAGINIGSTATDPSAISTIVGDLWYNSTVDSYMTRTAIGGNVRLVYIAAKVNNGIPFFSTAVTQSPILEQTNQFTYNNSTSTLSVTNATFRTTTHSSIITDSTGLTAATLGLTFQVSSGSNLYKSLAITPTYNFTGTYSGTAVVGIEYNPTVTAIPGGTSHIVMRTSSGRFMIGNNPSSLPTARVHIRGEGTTTGHALRIEDTGANTRLTVSDNGGIVSAVDSATSTTQFITGGFAITAVASITSGTFLNVSNAFSYDVNGGSFARIVPRLSYSSTNGGTGFDVTASTVDALTSLTGTGTVNLTRIMMGQSVSTTYNGNFNLLAITSVPASGININAGTSTLKMISINPSMDYSGTVSSSFVYGIDYSPTFNNVVGITHIAARFTSGRVLIGVTSSSYAGILNVQDVANGRIATLGNFEISAGSSTPTNTGVGVAVEAPNRTMKLIGSGSALNASDTTNFTFSTGNTLRNTQDTNLVGLGTTWTPSSGTSIGVMLHINPNINTTGTYIGTFYGINYNPTLTSTTGLTHIAARFGSGQVLIGGSAVTVNTRLDVRGISGGLVFRLASDSNVSLFSVDNTGIGTINNSWSVTGSNNGLNVAGGSTSPNSYAFNITGGFNASSGAFGGFIVNNTNNSAGGTSVSFSNAASFTATVNHTGFLHNIVNPGNISGTHLAFHSTSGQVFFAAASGNTVTTTTRVDIRGISGGNALRVANDSNGLLFIVTNAGNIGFFGSAGASQQVSGANLTNNVTTGGTDNEIADVTDLTSYGADSATIRNNFYQLARKLKQVNDALRLYGLLT